MCVRRAHGKTGWIGDGRQDSNPCLKAAERSQTGVAPFSPLPGDLNIRNSHLEEFFSVRQPALSPLRKSSANPRV
jgi:hypothetical protein